VCVWCVCVCVVGVCVCVCVCVCVWCVGVCVCMYVCVCVVCGCVCVCMYVCMYVCMCGPTEGSWLTRRSIWRPSVPLAAPAYKRMAGLWRRHLITQTALTLTDLLSWLQALTWKMVSPGIEPETYSVFSRHDDFYTTQPFLCTWGGSSRVPPASPLTLLVCKRLALTLPLEI